jgi:hypothetical protein
VAELRHYSHKQMVCYFHCFLKKNFSVFPKNLFSRNSCCIFWHWYIKINKPFLFWIFEVQNYTPNILVYVNIHWTFFSLLNIKFFMKLEYLCTK